MPRYDEYPMDEVNQENTTFMSWLQSFTKKIVTVFSILYVLIIIVLVSMLGIQLHAGFSDGLSTMITEINETFRVVIGGYLIKATIENGFKITGSFLCGINKSKIDAMLDNSSDESTEDNEDPLGDDE